MSRRSAVAVVVVVAVLWPGAVPELDALRDERTVITFNSMDAGMRRRVLAMRAQSIEAGEDLGWLEQCFPPGSTIDAASATVRLR